MRPHFFWKTPILLAVCVLTVISTANAAPVRYVIDSSQSSVHFDAKSTAHPFSGDTRALSGEMTWDAAERQILEGAVIRVPIVPILTGESKRDDAMRKMFNVSVFPEIEFKPLKLTAPEPSAAPGTSAGIEHYRLEGVLKIRQIEKAIILNVTTSPSADGSLEVSGETQVRTDWFALKPPSVLGLIRVLPEVKLRFKSVWKKYEPAV